MRKRIKYKYYLKIMKLAFIGNSILKEASNIASSFLRWRHQKMIDKVIMCLSVVLFYPFALMLQIVLWRLLEDDQEVSD